MRGTRLGGVATAAVWAVLGFASPAPAQQSTVDLLSQFHLRIDGPVAQEFGRISVERAGDVNGDGRADIVVGLPPTAYVVFGRSSPGTVDLAALGTGGFRISGDTGVGGDVAGAGDMNGDGRDDLIIGAPGVGFGGRAYVVFGKGTTTPIDVAALGAGGFRVDGPPAAPSPFSCPGVKLGESVDGVGDFNADGRPDVVVAGWTITAARCGGPLISAAYVVYGKATTATVDLADPQGAASLLASGTNAAGAGDVNGDGRPDVVVGTGIPQFTVGDGASVHFAGGGGFSILGVGAGDAVAGAGDVNDDGRGDVAIGDPDASNNGRSFSGSAWVVFGKTSTTDVDLGALGGGGYRIDGARGGDPGFLGDQAGAAVDGAGDVNGDGRPDVLVGAPGASNNGRRFSGSAYVVYGKSSTTTIDLAALGAGGLRIDGAGGGTPPVPPTDPGTLGDQAGSSVAGAGDMTGDGRPDVLVGAPGADNNGRQNSGSAYLVSFGARDTTAPVLQVPPKLKVDAMGPGGARVVYSASASDDTDPNPSVSCDPPSGATFPVGKTTVSCTATDSAGNAATTTFAVKVKKLK